MKPIRDALDKNSYLKDYAEGCPLPPLNKVDFSAEVWWQCTCLNCKAEWAQKPNGPKPTGQCPQCGGNRFGYA